MTLAKKTLPTVTESIASIVIGEVLSNKNYVDQFLQRLETENPLVVELINTHSSISSDPENVKYVGSIVYILLEKSSDLPKVSDDAYNSLLEESVKQNYIKAIAHRLVDDNPIVVNYVISMASKANDKKQSSQIAALGLLVYRLLEKQSEMNQYH